MQKALPSAATPTLSPADDSLVELILPYKRNGIPAAKHKDVARGATLFPAR
jgi:hypothetical protein